MHIPTQRRIRGISLSLRGAEEPCSQRHEESMAFLRCLMLICASIDVLSATEVDLLLPIGIPLADGINYVKGKEGLPAFELTERTDIKAPASLVSEKFKLFPDFSVLLTIKPYEQKGGYLFAIVNPYDTILEFGVSISSQDNGLQSVDIHYTDYKLGKAAKPFIKFTVPSMVQEWTRIAISFRGNVTKLYYECR